MAMESTLIFLGGLIAGGGIFLFIKQLKKEKLISEQKLKLDSFPFGVLLYDKKSEKITYANLKAVEFLGEVSQSKVNGRKLNELLGNVKQSEVFDYQKDSLEIFEKKDKFYQKSSFDYNGKEYGDIFFDVTELKNNESHLKKAQEISDKANRTKSLFLASMSHEIRTPMNAIIGISNMLMRYQNKNLTKKQIEGIGLINSSGDRLLNLINEILDLSKIEAGKMVLNKKDILLSNLFSQLKVLVYSLIGKKEITFRINKSNFLPERIHVDNNKLNQVLVNILGNSVKFTEKGNIVLNVHRKDKQLVFEVTDTGIGIDKKDLPYIFDEFKQLNHSNAQLDEDTKGTGLGLALCKKIITLMGGDISAESELNKGTTIVFSIPLEAITEKKKIVEHEKKRAANKNIKIDSNINVLVIDKDYDTFYLLKNYIEPYNCRIYFANSSSDGLKMLDQIKPQIIFLELDMPDYSGYDILRRMKKRGCGNMQIIVHSSVSCPSQEKYCYNKYLKKPVDENELKSMLNTVFSDTNLNRIEKKKILLVEDDVASIYTIKLMLDSSYDLIYAKNGKQGIEKFLQENPDLVLMDIKMPVLDGIESLKEIRKHNTKTPILAITAKVMPHEKLEIISAGFDDFIAKPVVQEKLLNSIGQYL